VTFLAERDLARRRADNRDGRARLLELADRGAAEVARPRRQRESAVGDLLAGWTPLTPTLRGSRPVTGAAGGR
jgi:DNA-binding MarR family transcriptional regulator